MSSQRSQPSTAAFHSPLMAAPGEQRGRGPRCAVGRAHGTPRWGQRRAGWAQLLPPLGFFLRAPSGSGCSDPRAAPSGAGERWGRAHPWWAAQRRSATAPGQQRHNDSGSRSRAARRRSGGGTQRICAAGTDRHRAELRRRLALLTAEHGRAPGCRRAGTTGGTAGRSPPSCAGGREPRDELRWPRSTGAFPPALGQRRRGSRCRVTPCCFGCCSASASALC